MIILDAKSQLVVDIIGKVSQGKITIANAAKLLSRSRRTIERYFSQYHQHGIKFVIHGNSGRKPSNKISDELKRHVQLLIKEKYYDLNLQHLAERFNTDEGIDIKRETLRSWAHEIHHVKRAKKGAQGSVSDVIAWNLLDCYCKWMAVLTDGLAIKNLV